jgi:hypothetical protein
MILSPFQFARFTHVNQIPADFISRELQLSGRVRDVLPSGLLHIEHEPMIRLPSIWRRPRLTDKVKSKGDKRADLVR